MFHGTSSQQQFNNRRGESGWCPDVASTHVETHGCSIPLPRRGSSVSSTHARPPIRRNPSRPNLHAGLHRGRQAPKVQNSPRNGGSGDRGGGGASDQHRCNDDGGMGGGSASSTQALPIFAPKPSRPTYHAGLQRGRQAPRRLVEAPPSRLVPQRMAAPMKTCCGGPLCTKGKEFRRESDRVDATHELSARKEGGRERSAPRRFRKPALLPAELSMKTCGAQPTARPMQPTRPESAGECIQLYSGVHTHCRETPSDAHDRAHTRGAQLQWMSLPGVPPLAGICCRGVGQRIYVRTCVLGVADVNASSPRAAAMGRISEPPPNMLQTGNTRLTSV